MPVGLPTALAVVASFALFYRNTTRDALLGRLRGQFGAVAELCVMDCAADDPDKAVSRPDRRALRGCSCGVHGRTGARVEGVHQNKLRTGHRPVCPATSTVQLPAELLEHLAAGLAIAAGAGEDGEGGDAAGGGKAKGPAGQATLPPEWEARARELLSQPETKAKLEALQRPLDAVRADLKGLIEGALRDAQRLAAGATGAAGAAGTAGAASGLDGAPSLPSAVRDGLTLASPRGAGPAGAGAAGQQPPAVRWIAIAGFEDAALREAAASVLPAGEAAKVGGPRPMHRRPAIACVGRDAQHQVLACLVVVTLGV